MFLCKAAAGLEESQQEDEIFLGEGNGGLREIQHAAHFEPGAPHFDLRGFSLPRIAGWEWIQRGSGCRIGHGRIRRDGMHRHERHFTS